MIGFPGAHYDYKEWVARHGEPVPYAAGRHQGPARLAGAPDHGHNSHPVDAVLVGFGWTGAIMGQQLCDAGLNVLALERGPWRDTSTDFAHRASPRTSCATCGATTCSRTSPTTR